MNQSMIDKGRAFLETRRPSDAQAMILAQCKITDTVTETIFLGWSSFTRTHFLELRSATDRCRGLPLHWLDIRKRHRHIQAVGSNWVVWKHPHIHPTDVIAEIIGQNTWVYHAT